MDLFTTGYGWEFLFRWFHLLAGIVWIGMLYYFNLVQTPFFASELGGQAKNAMTRGLVPNAMWWFRWGAMFTFLTGWLLVLIGSIRRQTGDLPQRAKTWFRLERSTPMAG